ncbi:MAG: hypothetical protein CMF69_00310 [Magnetovibrio sp.]|nr:hypothetical protein [Magnetovibrio sp.]
MADKLKQTVSAWIRFVAGERPSADKFNALVAQAKRGFENIEYAIGDIRGTGWPYLYRDDSFVDTYLTTSYGRKWDQNVEVDGGKKGGRPLDIANLARLIGPASNLNPMVMTNGLTSDGAPLDPNGLNVTADGIHIVDGEAIPVGVNQFSLRYMPDDVVAMGPGDFFGPNVMDFFLTKVGDASKLAIPGDFAITEEGEIHTYIPTGNDLSVRYNTRPSAWAGGPNYSGATFNVIPDPTQSFHGDSCGITGPHGDGSYTITTPTCTRMAKNFDSDSTELTKDNDINSTERILLPEWMESAFEPGDVLPPGTIYLKCINTNEVFEDATYFYENQWTVTVKNIDIGNAGCSLVYALVTVGTDITTSIDDVRRKQFQHTHDRKFGEPFISIWSITDILAQGDNWGTPLGGPYYGSSIPGDHSPFYIHRDGFRFNHFGFGIDRSDTNAPDAQSSGNSLRGALILASRLHPIDPETGSAVGGTWPYETLAALKGRDGITGKQFQGTVHNMIWSTYLGETSNTQGVATTGIAHTDYAKGGNFGESFHISFGGLPKYYIASTLNTSFEASIQDDRYFPSSTGAQIFQNYAGCLVLDATNNPSYSNFNTSEYDINFIASDPQLPNSPLLWGNGHIHYDAPSDYDEPHRQYYGNGHIRPLKNIDASSNASYYNDWALTPTRQEIFSGHIGPSDFPNSIRLVSPARISLDTWTNRVDHFNSALPHEQRPSYKLGNQGIDLNSFGPIDLCARKGEHLSEQGTNLMGDIGTINMYADDGIHGHVEGGNIHLQAKMRKHGEIPPVLSWKSQGGCIYATAYNHFDIKSLSKWTGAQARTSSIRSGNHLLLQAGSPWARADGNNIDSNIQANVNTMSNPSQLMISSPSSISKGGIILTTRTPDSDSTAAKAGSNAGDPDNLYFGAGSSSLLNWDSGREICIEAMMARTSSGGMVNVYDIAHGIPKSLQVGTGWTYHTPKTSHLWVKGKPSETGSSLMHLEDMNDDASLTRIQDTNICIWREDGDGNVYTDEHGVGDLDWCNANKPSSIPDNLAGIYAMNMQDMYYNRRTNLVLSCKSGSHDLGVNKYIWINFLSGKGFEHSDTTGDKYAPMGQITSIPAHDVENAGGTYSWGTSGNFQEQNESREYFAFAASGTMWTYVGFGDLPMTGAIKLASSSAQAANPPNANHWVGVAPNGTWYDGSGNSTSGTNTRPFKPFVPPTGEITDSLTAVYNAIQTAINNNEGRIHSKPFGDNLTPGGTVQYVSGGSDFAEQVLIADYREWTNFPGCIKRYEAYCITKERMMKEGEQSSTDPFYFGIPEGTIVYLRNERIHRFPESSKERGMVVTKRAAVLGNMLDTFCAVEDVSFAGQVPVRVINTEKIEPGDYLVPLTDKEEHVGFCKAVSPEDISFDEYKKAIGSAIGYGLISEVLGNKVALVDAAIGVK